MSSDLSSLLPSAMARVSPGSKQADSFPQCPDPPAVHFLAPNLLQAEGTLRAQDLHPEGEELRNITLGSRIFILLY